jgi:hypothetical protein
MNEGDMSGKKPENWILKGKFKGLMAEISKNPGI